MLNGSAWSTEKKYMRRYKGAFDIFFGIELGLRKEEMEEQFNKEPKEGWRFKAYTSNLGAVVGEKEGAIMSIPGNDGRIVQV